MSTLYTNRLFLNGDKVKQMYINGSKVYQLVEGTAPVPPTPTPYEEQYLTFEILSAGTIVWKASDTGYTKTIQYSKDNGETWTSITSTNTGASFNVVAGDKVLFKGNNAAYGSSDGYSTFSDSTAKYNLYGNIMSLISGDEFSGSTALTSSYNFKHLFAETSTVNASNLVLPATTLTEGCYRELFSNCRQLDAVPELPATTLASRCYYQMFANCVNFKTAPLLPATTLANNCYLSMFQGCLSLISAPELPATTLTSSCYYGMFNGCKKVNYIKCLATDISASSCTYRWVYDISSTGTFVKAPSMSGWKSGTSGIPNNWTVQDAS